MRTIEVKGRKCPFKVTVSALMKYEDEFGKSFSPNDMGVKGMAKILYFGLEAGARIANEKLTVTEEEIGDMDLQELQEAINTATKDFSEKVPK